MQRGEFHIRDAARESWCARAEEEAKNALDQIEKEFLDIDGMTEEKLMELSGKELHEIYSLTFRVDTTEQSIAQLGGYLPNIKELILSNSIIRSFRDFGTSLRNLQVLHLECSGVSELDGFCALEGLVELYLENNRISDLTPLAMHENLKNLHLQRNNISDLNQIDQLGTCYELKLLDLSGNPVCGVTQYRNIIVHHIPQLQLLDDMYVSEADREPCSTELLEQVMNQQYDQTHTMHVDTGCTGGAPGAAFVISPKSKHPTRPANINIDEIKTTPFRPVRPSTSAGIRRQKSSDSPPSARSNDPSLHRLSLDDSSINSNSSTIIRPGSSRHSRQPVANPNINSWEAYYSETTNSVKNSSISSSSELTHGTDVVFTGNFASAMRRRRSSNNHNHSVDHTDHTTSENSTSTIFDQINDKTFDDVLDDLKTWKVQLEDDFNDLKACKMELEHYSQSNSSSSSKKKKKPVLERRTSSRRSQLEKHKSDGNFSVASAGSGSCSTPATDTPRGLVEELELGEEHTTVASLSRPTSRGEDDVEAEDHLSQLKQFAIDLSDDSETEQPVEKPVETRVKTKLRKSSKQHRGSKSKVKPCLFSSKSSSLYSSRTNPKPVASSS